MTRWGFEETEVMSWSFRRLGKRTKETGWSPALHKHRCTTGKCNNDYLNCPTKQLSISTEGWAAGNAVPPTQILPPTCPSHSSSSSCVFNHVLTLRGWLKSGLNYGTLLSFCQILIFSLRDRGDHMVWFWPMRLRGCWKTVFSSDKGNPFNSYDLFPKNKCT